MKRKNCSNKKNQRGQAMVEFALVAGLFFFLTFSVVQFIAANYQKHAIYLAVKEAIALVANTTQSNSEEVTGEVVSKIQEVLKKHGINETPEEIKRNLVIQPENYMNADNNTPVTITFKNHLWVPITLKEGKDGKLFTISASASAYKNYFGAA